MSTNRPRRQVSGHNQLNGQPTCVPGCRVSTLCQWWVSGNYFRVQFPTSQMTLRRDLYQQTRRFSLDQRLHLIHNPLIVRRDQKGYVYMFCQYFQGSAMDCKSVYTGSIPVLASKPFQ
jgi:hypothetical protein